MSTPTSKVPSSVLTLEETVAFTKPVVGPREELPLSTDILIIGGGVVGLTALNLLGALNVNCALVERNLITSDAPKAIAIDDEFIRLLSNLGHEDRVLSSASKPFGIHFKSRKSRPLITVKAFHTLNGFGNRVAISQPVLEKILLEHRSKSTASVRFGVSFISLTQTGSGVMVCLHDENGHKHMIHAKYVLACDGSNSSVRQMLNITFKGRRIDEPHLVIDLAEFPDQTPASRFFCSPLRPLNSIPGPFGGRRLEFMLMPGDDREWLLQDEGIRWLVDNFSPYSGIELKIIRRAIYGFSERIADKFQVGRVFLLGDAAHVMPPFGGQGLNTGARDVANLCWKIDAVLSESIKPTALESYDDERRLQVSQIVKYSVNIGRLTNINSNLAALLRDSIIQFLYLIPNVRRYLSEMKYMPRPSILQGLLLDRTKDTSGIVGKVFPRLHGLDIENKQTILDHWVGFRHALVFINAEPSELLETLNIAKNYTQMIVANIVTKPGLVLGRSTLLCDDMNFSSFLNLHTGHCLLVRPDKYVAARTTNAKSKDILLSYGSLIGHM